MDHIGSESDVEEAEEQYSLSHRYKVAKDI